MTPLTSDRNVAAHTILERAVCLTLSCHYLGNNRTVDLVALVKAAGEGRTDMPDHLAVDADAFSAKKKLVDPKELRPVKRLLSQAKAYLRGVAISSHQVFGERSYLVPLALLDEADERLTAISAEIWIEAGKLADRYEEAVERQRAKHGSMFKASDYPDKTRVRAAFSLDWDYMQFGAPDRIETVNRAIYERTVSKYETKYASAFDAAVVEMRTAALDVVSELLVRLEPDARGNKKGLRGTALRDLQEYMRTLPHRNFGDDDELVRVMERVSAVAGGDVDRLKESETLQSELRPSSSRRRRRSPDSSKTRRVAGSASVRSVRLRNRSKPVAGAAPTG